MRIITEFVDFLDMHAIAQNMSREEYTAYYLSEGELNEASYGGNEVFEISTPAPKTISPRSKKQLQMF